MRLEEWEEEDVVAVVNVIDNSVFVAILLCVPFLPVAMLNYPSLNLNVKYKSKVSYYFFAFSTISLAFTGVLI